MQQGCALAERARILVVDDDIAARLTLQAILGDLYDVVVAIDVLEAERILETQEIEVLLTDYDMPGRSGVDLITLVLDRFPQVVPILLTGHTSKLEVRTADRDRNIFAVLSKPYDPAALLRSLRLAVATAQLRSLHRPMIQRNA